MEALALWLVRLVGLYLLVGFCFGLFFVIHGINRIDPSARSSGWGFRLIILPGVIALWPLLTSRMLRNQSSPPVECTAHRRASGDQ